MNVVCHSYCTKDQNKNMKQSSFPCFAQNKEKLFELRMYVYVVYDMIYLNRICRNTENMMEVL